MCIRDRHYTILNNGRINFYLNFREHFHFISSNILNVYREREIIEACKRLDSIAQKTLYEHFLPMAYNLCKRYISDPDELKDILQEGFIKVFMSIETFSYKGSFEGWMKRIFISTTVSHLRKHKNYRYKIKYEENINLPDNTVTEPDNVLFGNQIDKKDIDCLLYTSRCV